MSDNVVDSVSIPNTQEQNVALKKEEKELPKNATPTSSNKANCFFAKSPQNLILSQNKGEENK